MPCYAYDANGSYRLPGRPEEESEELRKLPVSARLGAKLKPWQVMLLFSISMGIIVGVIVASFPSLNLLALLAGAITIVVVGKRVFEKGDSNEKQSNS